MKIQKFGTISENAQGQLVCTGFNVDAEGQTIYSEEHANECLLDLITERFLALKKKHVNARQVAWLEQTPIEHMPRA
jgi:hypothetical protein